MPVTDDDAQQIVGRERRERVSQHEWCGEGCVNSRRPANSDVGPLILLFGDASEKLLGSDASRCSCWMFTNIKQKQHELAKASEF